MPKVVFTKYQKPRSTIDPLKHAAKLKEIEEHIAADAAAAALAAQEEEQFEEEEEMCESEFSLSEGEPAFGIGKIDLSFPETVAEFENSPQCYPPSYYTLSPKERLILLYGENFRKQFVVRYPKRRALVLAPQNECNVQKFVCTTIRPTAFIYTDLISSIENIAKFVADFIQYEPLEDEFNLPTRLISPDTLLRKRHGNSFEMATLLCSMLIGAGHPAMVVSGVAREETVLNDQQTVPYPYAIVEVEAEEPEVKVEKAGVKYKLRPMPDLHSHLDEQMAEVMRLKTEEENRLQEELIQKHLKELELLAVDRYHYRRSHAWVVIIDNAPWSIKPRITYTDVNGDVQEAPPKATFIEPSTGFICDTNHKQYILVDSVWNQYNYYVNKQKCQRVGEMRWDLRELEDWEHLLPGEPPEMRVYKQSSDSNILDEEHDVDDEKHLDFLVMWVNRLHIGLRDYEQRFPNREKKIQYKGAIHERFSPYSQRDGKVAQLTIFNDDACTNPKVRYEYYENRADRMRHVKYIYETDMYKEIFGKGRNDCLKSIEYSGAAQQRKKMNFFSASRLDALDSLEINPETGLHTLFYKGRSDSCWFKEFELNVPSDKLKRIVEKFRPNTVLDVGNNEIAIRTFLFNSFKIILQFHYNAGALTASTVEFQIPPRPDYGKELEYDEKMTKVYKANPLDPTRSNLELYKLLLQQLEHMERVKKQFDKIQSDIYNLCELRKTEKKEPKLKFSIFDPLRNGAARAIRMKQHEEEEEHRREIAGKPADFLAPYLVPFGNQELTFEQSAYVYNACLNDMKIRFVNLLNNLQRQYEDLTSESKSLKRFLTKFENQFDTYDYRRLVQQAKDIELNKRMVQQRLTLTHEESQKKYENVKASLLKDPRLNLPQDPDQSLSENK
ncbi:coiled-coil domain-containing protein lobo [Scaptodrosophila lebanonensis]|uniref:Coiled-coil domain-containing protein lobo n=1 Tax=Drosophila lebanonensis TaxID=7225 RepID=A0A6J2U507_DROLE|nr:coiled-coil domain-containing protein lobo [Scaptodrosophila lebanonensis]